MVLHSPLSSADSLLSEQRTSSNEDIVAEKEKIIRDLQRELTARDRLINHQRSQLDEATKNLSIATKRKVLLTNQLAEQDRKMALVQQDSQPLLREELHVVHEALNSLRKSYPPNDPHHHTLDTVEQSISLLMERLHLAEMQSMTLQSQATGGNSSQNTMPTNKETLSLPLAKCPLLDSRLHPLTKVIYFTEGAPTPRMSTISKRLGEITLSDFKYLLHQPGDLRFHFKTMDPEFGVVKEEVMHDEDILPGMDGKIIAWVESRQD